MTRSLDVPRETGRNRTPFYTHEEIFQQPAIWLTTLSRVRDACLRQNVLAGLNNSRVLLTGAGSSAYAAMGVAASWPRSSAVPSTDLLIDTERYLREVDAVISLARSGDSPESAGVVERIRALRPKILQFAITCNEYSELARAGLNGLIVLDERCNDRSLVMTSSFSNLVLAGNCLAQADRVSSVAELAVERANALLPEIDNRCRRAAGRARSRIVVLSSSPMLGWGMEAGLKATEMTAGHFPVVAETYLGLRHGPMAFLERDTLVICLLSSDPLRRLYEEDLIRELQSKKLGYLVGIVDPQANVGLFDEVIPAVLPRAADALRTPYEIMAPQLLGYHLSLSIGLNPDNPSPDGIINRVVQGVRIHSARK